MTNRKFPKTPFATSLVQPGEATRQRIRRILRFPKMKRPPAVFLALAALAVLLCGNLAACRSGEEPPPQMSPAGTPLLPERPGETAALWPPEETAAPEAPVFPTAGEMLDIDCPPYAPPADDGSRRVTIQWLATYEEAEYSYDLPNTQAVSEGPELTLSREWNNGAIWLGSTPVDDAADRAYLLELIEQAVFQTPDSPPNYAYGNVRLHVTEDGGTEQVYDVCPDGTLMGKAADGSTQVSYDAVDYFHVSALTYKYASSKYGVGASPEGWFAWEAPERKEDPPPGYPEELPADSYRMCIQGEDFHADLDREQALLLLRALFGGAEAGSPELPRFGVSPWDWTAPEGGIRMTEYLYDEYTLYEGSDGPQVRERSVFLYPDGTAAQTATDFGAWYRWRTDNALEHETISPSWQRVILAENAFSWAMLTACLGRLS